MASSWLHPPSITVTDGQVGAARRGGRGGGGGSGECVPEAAGRSRVGGVLDSVGAAAGGRPCTRDSPTTRAKARIKQQQNARGGGAGVVETHLSKTTLTLIHLPQEVEKLELVYYDKHLQDEAAATGEAGALVGSRLATLIDIQMEFVSPYGELRTELTALKVGMGEGLRARLRLCGVGDPLRCSPIRDCGCALLSPPAPLPFPLCCSLRRRSGSVRARRRRRSSRGGAWRPACGAWESRCVCGGGRRGWGRGGLGGFPGRPQPCRWIPCLPALAWCMGPAPVSLWGAHLVHLALPFLACFRCRRMRAASCPISTALRQSLSGATSASGAARTSTSATSWSKTPLCRPGGWRGGVGAALCCKCCLL